MQKEGIKIISINITLSVIVSLQKPFPLWRVAVSHRENKKII
jgi:hypothetical protein